MIKKRSLKLRITMWYSLFMFTITFALAAIVLIVINRNSETVIKEDLKSTVEAAAAEITGTKGTDIMQLLKQSVDGHYVAVYGKNGELWVRGYIHVMSQTDYLQFMERILFIALPIIVVIMIVGGWFLTKRALKPLEQMEQEAKSITNGDDLGKRLYVENGYDEIQRLSITVNEMLQRLQNSFEAERQFISDASHELRTPISVILMQCESFDKDSTIFEYEQGNKLIKRQTNKMKALVDNLLQLSRLNSQKQVNYRRLLIYEEAYCKKNIIFEFNSCSINRMWS